MTPFSIRRRLFWSLLIAVAVLSTAASIAIYLRAKADINELFDYEMKQLVFSLGTHISSHPGLVDEPLLRADHDFVTQVWRGPSLIASSGPRSGPNRPLPAGFGSFGTPEGGWRTFTAEAGEYTLQVAQRVAERREIAAKIALNAVAPAAAMLPLGGLIIWFGIGYGLRPLRIIARDLSARKAEALDPVTVANPPVEIAALLDALNALLARLHEALQKDRQFIADASHELRTPATALGLQIDLLESAQSAEQRDEAVRDLRLGIDRMQRLIEQILTAARLDPENHPAAEELDLASLLEDICREFEAPAAKKGLRLANQIDVRPRIVSDAVAWRALVRNLLDNAIRYTPAGGAVKVELAATEHELIVAVADSGPGIPAALREQAFERFFRKDGSADDGGSGLGLSIAKRAADRLGANLLLREGTGGRGLTAQIRLSATRRT